MTEVERERWRRIRAAKAAYAYEYMALSFISDAEFDELCLQIDTSVSTGNRKMDNFFKKHFSPHTGQWVHNHPEKAKLRSLVERHHCGG